MKRAIIALFIVGGLSACGSTGQAVKATPDGQQLTVSTASVTNIMAPSVTGYLLQKCDDDKCVDLDSGTVSQSGWLDPSAVGSAALLGWGISQSGTEVNQSGGGASANAAGGSAAAGASAKGGRGGTAVSGSVSNANASSSSSSSSNATGGSGGCFPPGHC